MSNELVIVEKFCIPIFSVRIFPAVIFIGMLAVSYYHEELLGTVFGL